MNLANLHNLRDERNSLQLLLLTVYHAFKIVHVGDEMTESQGVIKIGKMNCLLLKITDIIQCKHLIIGAR